MITIQYRQEDRTRCIRTMRRRWSTSWKARYVMQVKGGTAITLAPGQTFYEGPDDVHLVGRNASQTQRRPRSWCFW